MALHRATPLRGKLQARVFTESQLSTASLLRKRGCLVFSAEATEARGEQGSHQTSREARRSESLAPAAGAVFVAFISAEMLSTPLSCSVSALRTPGPASRRLLPRAGLTKAATSGLCRPLARSRS